MYQIRTSQYILGKSVRCPGIRLKRSIQTLSNVLPRIATSKLLDTHTNCPTSLLSTQQSFKTLTSRRMNSNYGTLLYTGTEYDKVKKLLGTFYVMSASIGVISPKVMSIVIETSSTLAVSLMSIHILVFVFLNPWGLYQFGKRYVHELYHDAGTDTYTVTLLSPTLTKPNVLQFSAKDCRMPANPSVFTSFFVGGRPLFINSDSMNYHDYMRMLRFASDYDYENPDRQQDYERSQKKKGKDET